MTQRSGSLGVLVQKVVVDCSDSKIEEVLTKLRDSAAGYYECVSGLNLADKAASDERKCFARLLREVFRIKASLMCSDHGGNVKAEIEVEKHRAVHLGLTVNRRSGFDRCQPITAVLSELMRSFPDVFPDRLEMKRMQDEVKVEVSG